MDSGQLKITLKGHSKTVWDVAFSPDGTTLASGGIDETVRLWNVDSGQLKAILKGHTDIITSVVFSPDGTTLASGGLDETVRLWDVSSGQLKITLKGHTDTVTSVAYSPDGTTLASGGIDETIRLWDVGSGQLSETLTGHVDEVRSIVFSPDGTTLASGGLDCTVKLWDATIGQHEATRRGHADGVMSVAYSPDGTMLASGGLDNTVILIPVSAVNINAYVQVGASERPPMYWVDTTFGTLHHLTGEKVEKLVADIQNVTDLAVDVADGKVYWTQKTSDRTGKVQRANLDGTDVQLVKDLTSVPHGIVLDTASSKIYLTNSWDKVQRMNLDGTNFQPNLITSLSSPKDIAVDVAGGKIYWTEEDRIRRANLNGSNIQTVATNLGTLGGIAIANGKIYWTEKTDENSGKIQAANLSGAINIEEIATFTTSVPLGVAVDTKEHKLYWTNSNRRIQRSNLSGEDIQGVASGLGAPAAIVLGTEPIAPVVAAAPTTAVASPDTTALLPNYPNPFNPETWIPYQLAKPADVTLTIYAVNGQIVRRLALGHQLVGTYQSKNRAAYWDGRNTVGEPVASGLYFYTFTAGDFTATRKMLIRK